MSNDDKKAKKGTGKTANASLTTDAQLHMTDPKAKKKEISIAAVTAAADKKKPDRKSDPEDKVIKFGSTIKAFRSKAGMSQAELAEMMKVSRNTVVKWENDGYKPEPEMAVKLCSILGMSLDELYGISTNALSALELRMMREFRRISPVGQRVIEKMIYHMLDEELKAKCALRLAQKFLAQMRKRQPKNEGNPRPAPLHHQLCAAFPKFQKKIWNKIIFLATVLTEGSQIKRW